jgi:hypothetical protein
MNHNTYITVFTKDADSYDLNRQLECIKKNENSYFVKRLNSDFDYASVDKCVQEAYNYGYSNFICLTEEDNFVNLDNALKEEYGSLFNEVKALPEQFYRLREGDIAGTTQPATAQTTQTSTAAVQPQQQKPLTQQELKVDPNGILHIVAMDFSYPILDNVRQALNDYIALMNKGGIYNFRYADYIDGQTFLNASSLKQIVTEQKIFKPLLKQLQTLHASADDGGVICISDSTALTDWITGELETMQKQQKQIKSIEIISPIAIQMQPINGIPVTVNNRALRSHYDAGVNKEIFNHLEALCKIEKNVKDGTKYSGITDTELQQEKDSGNIEYIRALMAATSFFEEHKEHVTRQNVAKFESELKKYLKDLAAIDYNNFKDFLAPSGLDVFVNVGEKALKDIKNGAEDEGRKLTSNQMAAKKIAVEIVGYKDYGKLKELLGLK